MRGERFAHDVVEKTVGREHGTLFHAERAPPRIGHAPSGGDDERRARCEIPRFELSFPEGAVGSLRDEAEIDGGAPTSHHALRSLYHRAMGREVVVFARATV